MPVTLTGDKELKARMNELRLVFKPIGRDWADETVRLARSNAIRHSRTGKMLGSIRRAGASKKRALVIAAWPAVVVEGPTKAHDIVPKKRRSLKLSDGSRTIFARRVHRRARAGTPFLKPAGADALRNLDISHRVEAVWNGQPAE